MPAPPWTRAIAPVCALASAIVSTACVTASTPLKTAAPTPEGASRVQVGASLPLPSRFFGELIDLSERVVDRIASSDADSPISEDEQRQAFESALGMLLFQPAPVLVVDARHGVTGDVDMGLRWAGPALRADAKWRFHRTGGGANTALGLAAAHHLGIGASVAADVYEIFESVDVIEYRRNDLEAALLHSSDDASAFGYHLGARYGVSVIRFESDLLDEIAVQAGSGPVRVTELMHHIAGTAGARIEYDRFRLLAELSVGRVIFQPRVLGERINYNGWLVEPGAALAVTW